jgi:hypothetical protein
MQEAAASQRKISSYFKQPGADPPAVAPGRQQQPFEYISNPEDTCRQFNPKDTWAADLFVKDDPDRTEWEQSAQAAIVDPEGCYRADHGFKNAKKIGIQPGQPASMGTWTCMTSQNQQVAIQTHVQNTSFKAITPSIIELQRRAKELGAPVCPHSSAFFLISTHRSWCYLHVVMH